MHCLLLLTPVLPAQMQDPYFFLLLQRAHHFVTHSTAHALCGRYLGIDGHAKITRSRCRAVNDSDDCMGSTLKLMGGKYCPRTPSPRMQRLLQGRLM